MNLFATQFSRTRCLRNAYGKFVRCHLHLTNKSIRQPVALIIFEIHIIRHFQPFIYNTSTCRQVKKWRDHINLCTSWINDYFDSFYKLYDYIFRPLTTLFTYSTTHSNNQHRLCIDVCRLDESILWVSCKSRFYNPIFLAR